MPHLFTKPATVVAILVVALMLRLAAAGWLDSHLSPGQRFFFGDSESYWRLAEALAQSKPYAYGGGMYVFRTPGYPVLLAGLFLLAGQEPPVLLARVWSAVLGVLSVVGVMWVAGQLFGRRTAFLAGSLTAVYPGAIAMSIFVLSESAFCPLMLLHLGCWIAATRAVSQRWRMVWSAAGGWAAGCATLVRPSWLLFTPLAVLMAVLACQNRRQHASMGMTMLAALILTMLPWWVRNHQVTGHFVPTTLQVGASLYDGLSPEATGASDMRFVTRFVHEQEMADAPARGTPPDTFEFRLDRRMRRAAVAWAMEHPAKVIQLVGVKFVRMWSPWPNAAEFQNGAIRFAVSLGYLPILLCSGWGAAMFWRRGWPYVLCVLPALYLTLLHVVFVSSIRYREPAMLSLIVLAAGAIAQAVPRVFPQEPQRRPLAGVVNAPGKPASDGTVRLFV